MTGKRNLVVEANGRLLSLQKRDVAVVGVPLADASESTRHRGSRDKKFGDPPAHISVNMLAGVSPGRRDMPFNLIRNREAAACSTISARCGSKMMPSGSSELMQVSQHPRPAGPPPGQVHGVIGDHGRVSLAMTSVFFSGYQRLSC